MIHIDVAEARKLLKMAVERNGVHYEYNNPHEDWDNDRYDRNEFSESTWGSGGPTCLYVHRDVDGNLEPGCIVGTAMHLAGLPLEVMAESNGDSITEKRYGAWPGVEITNEAANYFRMAQVQQDMGYSWGTAYECAEEAFESDNS